MVGCERLALSCWLQLAFSPQVRGVPRQSLRSLEKARAFGMTPSYNRPNYSPALEMSHSEDRAFSPARRGIWRGSLPACSQQPYKSLQATSLEARPQEAKSQKLTGQLRPNHFFPATRAHILTSNRYRQNCSLLFLAPTQRARKRESEAAVMMLRACFLYTGCDETTTPHCAGCFCFAFCWSP